MLNVKVFYIKTPGSNASEEEINHYRDIIYNYGFKENIKINKKDYRKVYDRDITNHELQEIKINPDDADVSTVLSIMFEKCQNLDWNENIIRRLDNRADRSMMTGDIIVVNKQVNIVRPVGFMKVDIEMED